MIALLHSAPKVLARYRTPNLGVLSSPRRFYMDVEGWLWAADNDAYSAWDERRYRHMLNRIVDLPGGLFVTLPDIVGNGDATIELMHQWLPELREIGKPVALVAQDGMTASTFPWLQVDAVFVGGTTEFKMGDVAREIVEEAKRRGMWVHMGRVNSHRRIRYAKAIGCDSFDGMRVAWFKDLYLDDFLDHAAAPTQTIMERT